MMHNIHTRNLREAIICNEFGQPIGPVTEEKDVVGKFSRFLGTIARTYSYAPLIYNSWHKVPNKDRMWEYVLEKYVVPGDAKPWVLKTIGACWRGHKSRLKKKHFYDLKDNSSRLKNRPKCIPEKDFLQLLRLWNKTEEKVICCKGTTNVIKNLHTAGPKSFARIREDMKNEDPNKEPPSLTKLFERTRERKKGHVYADTYDETERLIEKMKNYQAPKEEDGGGQDVSGPVDPFLVVMNKEYNGHRRLFGKGITHKLIKKVNGGETSYIVPTELMEYVKTAIDAEMKWLVEMRKQIEDDHERKKL
ncbi:transposase, Ptta/En/Spm [Artemisia annua]|uniref:Transposase, Ptta/En/Spm n=1 Tax=Artemisia annua TaxID=35608 RepID=A0A2U1NWP6_ARTAN|nr:transposase, Ptta/En/Spm [Artemisia annua]